MKWTCARKFKWKTSKKICKKGVERTWGRECSWSCDLLEEGGQDAEEVNWGLPNWAEDAASTDRGKRVLHPTETSLSIALERGSRQKVFRKSADLVFRSQNSPDLPSSIVGFARMLSDVKTSNWKSLALIAYLVNAMQLKLSKNYETRLI